MTDAVFSEAKKLHGHGFAVHWLKPKSKMPLESGWTTGPRKPWSELKSTYMPGLNLGVRTGEASKIGDHYLACIDVDIKDPKYRSQALTRLKELIGEAECPQVLSGSGNGSRHLYCVTRSAFKMITAAKEPGWEICIYSNGRQMVLPPSVHPDTGKAYRWTEFNEELPLLDFSKTEPNPTKNRKIPNKVSSKLPNLGTFTFKPTKVDVEWLPISDAVKEGIIHGTGVLDRSSYLLLACKALKSADLTQDEILSVLSDNDTFLGAVAYEHAKTSDRIRAAKWVYEYTLKTLERSQDAETIFGSDLLLDQKPKTLTKIEVAETEEEFKEGKNWEDDILRGGNKKDGAPLKLVQNVVLILKNAVHQQLVRRNLFSYRDTYSCDTPWGSAKDAVVSDDDEALIKQWLSLTYGFEPPSTTIREALIVITHENAYDPVKDTLNALPPWDGVPRLDTWLKDNFEAKGCDDYLSQVFRKWMVAMVMRAFVPGSKFDWMPIFEGMQGIGKSSFGRLLVGDKYFLDWLPNLNDKDSALALQGMWAVEMGELSQFRRNELESIKAFITRTVDKVRPPFGRRLIESERRCVFFGTTNRERYLNDDTGNRRFKPVIVGNLNFKRLKKDRAQLFAEAKYLWDNKIETERSLELSGDAKDFERKIHQEKMVEDDSNAMIQAIEDFFEEIAKKSLIFDLNKFRILQLFEGVGPLTKWSRNNRNLQFAAKALRKLGAEKRMLNGLSYWKKDLNAKF